jgi:hypothetical protein
MLAVFRLKSRKMINLIARLLGFSFALCFGVANAQAHGVGEKAENCSYSYGPSKVQLFGTIIKKQFFGEPGFGENPSADKKEKIYLLKLDKKIDILASPSDDLNSESFKDVALVQLEFSGESHRDELIKLVGKHASVSGSLGMAMTGHEHTDVVLMVDAVHRSNVGKDSICN